MELRQLRQFIVLAEEGSFSVAAQRLHMAQPPLSVAIRKLEEEIGLPLFVRGSRGVRLTAAGEAALAAARRSLDAASQIAAAALQAEAGDAGRLRIGFSGSVTVRLLPRLVQAFSQRCPAVHLSLSEGTNLELLSRVAAGALDLGLVRLPTSRPPELRFQQVEEDHFCLALPKGHALARKPSIRLAQLENQPFIAYAPSPVGGLHAAASRVLQDAGVAPRVTQEAVQVQTVLGLVASGLGVALVPAANTVYQRSSGAVFRPIADLPPAATIGIALAHHGRNPNPALRRFLTVAEGEATRPGARPDPGPG
ncbi:MAG TPA: LysR family transcriptional regulator [Variovorax sp.]|nr:LysR family transcriptional regulator [Variovorax sp.]